MELVRSTSEMVAFAREHSRDNTIFDVIYTSLSVNGLPNIDELFSESKDTERLRMLIVGFLIDFGYHKIGMTNQERYEETNLNKVSRADEIVMSQLNENTLFFFAVLQELWNMQGKFYMHKNDIYNLPLKGCW